jgi:hypothetical protein
MKAGAGRERMETREEAAAFIARMAEHMALLAAKHRLPVLEHLLSMVIAEASTERKSKRV